MTYETWIRSTSYYFILNLCMFVIGVYLSSICALVRSFSGASQLRLSKEDEQFRRQSAEGLWPMKLEFDQPLIILFWIYVCSWSAFISLRFANLLDPFQVLLNWGYQKKMSNLEDNPPRDYDLWNLNSINLLLFYFEFMYVRDRRLSLFDLRIY